MSNIDEIKRVCLLDLNYTLVSNQQETKYLRPFTRRMEAEEYRKDLIEAIKDDYVIIITARPDHQMSQTMENIKKKTGWLPDEWYFNDINAEPTIFKESALNRFIFPRFKTADTHDIEFYAVESNPRTRAMYSKYGIAAQPYDKFIKGSPNTRVEEKAETENSQMTLYDMA